jgi:hypothetical protein
MNDDRTSAALMYGNQNGQNLSNLFKTMGNSQAIYTDKVTSLFIVNKVSPGVS